MKRLIAGGTGFIGQALIKRWLARDIECIVLGRNTDKIKQTFGDTVTALDWQSFSANSQTLLSECDHVINLCGANIGNHRWTASYRQTILDSRIKTTTALAEACAQLKTKSPRLLNASAIGVYGLQEEISANLPPAFDESSDTSGPAHDFLSAVGRTWEEATAIAEQAEVKVVQLRFGVVLAKRGGALSQIALPFRCFIGGPVGSGNQPFSWISLEDLCGAIDFIIGCNDLSGPINCVALQAVSQRQFAHALGRALHRPSFLPTPAFALRLLLGKDRAEELLLKGQHVVPTRLSELGFSFQQPDIDSALAAIYG